MSDRLSLSALVRHHGRRSALRSLPLLRKILILVFGTVGPLHPRCRKGLKGLTVFVFHDVTSRPSLFSQDLGMATDPELFRHQLKWIKRDFAVINPRDLGNEGLPPRPAILTFDDGFADFRSTALPILEEFEMPAVVFLNMDVSEGSPNAVALRTWKSPDSSNPNLWQKSTPHGYRQKLGEIATLEMKGDLLRYQGDYLGPVDLKALQDHPLVSIANHLDNHWSVPDLDPSEFERALLDNQQRLEAFENSLRWYAHPHGIGTATTHHRAGELGFTRVFTGGGKLNPNPSSPVLDRIDIDRTIGSRIAFRWRLTFRTLFPRRYS